MSATSDSSQKKKRRLPKKTWAVRDTVAMPRASFEELEIRTADGAVLRALVDDPPEGVALRGSLVLSHAMFARKTSFGRRDRPGLSSALAAEGYRTVAFDFRGHGDSTSPSGVGAWTYDELVHFDMPAVVECVRARGEDKPVIVVGHSLGGHVSVAAQGTGRLHADGLLLLATNVWLKEFEPSRARWLAKVAVARSMLAVSKRAHGFPARRLKFGSDDASEPYLEDLFRVITAGSWSSAAGESYLDAMPNVTIPVAAVVGDKDRIMCHPTSGELFANRCRGQVQVFHARDSGHMGLLKEHRIVGEALDWLGKMIA